MATQSPKPKLAPPISHGDRRPSIPQLLQQLEQIDQVANSGFWLTTDELATLLNLEDAALDELQMQIQGLQSSSKQALNPFPRFFWRNFECVPVQHQARTQEARTQGSTDQVTTKYLQREAVYWQIRKQAASDLESIPTNSLNPNLELDKRSPQPLTITNPESPQIPIPEPEIIPSPFAIIDDFLPPEQLKALLNYSINKQAQFIPTTNSANDPNYRRSFFLHQFPEFSELMIGLIRDIKPQIIAHLGIPDFKIGQIESQITAHNHGNYYKIHNDNGSPDSATRVLTYVYYYHREPKAFTGGELVIYDSKVENGYYVAASTYNTVQPTNNTIVFFPSKCMHEVLPVSCPSEYFANSRFTVNGWLRHA